MGEGGGERAGKLAVEENQKERSRATTNLQQSYRELP